MKSQPGGVWPGAGHLHHRGGQREARIDPRLRRSYCACMAVVVHQPASNLPADISSFVDRQVDLAAVRRLLSSRRLVTLSGPPGIGKTRLALRVARGLRRVFRDGIWYVEVGAVPDPALVDHTVVQAVGIHDVAGGDPGGQLADFLAGRHVLLVLDGCEPHPTACAELVGRLLSRCPRLWILATSREVLRAYGEQVWTLSPLAGPGSRPAGRKSPAVDDPAATLFAHRARAVDPSFRLTRSNRAQVTALCRRLDGIPLAIELAAARVPAVLADDPAHLAPQEERSQVADADPLQHAIARSFELCSKPQQRLWARASVYTGSFSLAAAERVCTGDDIAADHVMGLVGDLVDMSVLLLEQQVDEPRFGLLEALREYGLRMLAQTGQAAPARRRHTDWCLRLAEEGERNWFGPEQMRWLHLIELEHTNLRQALDECARTGNGASGLRLASTLWFYWHTCGHLTEGRYWLARMLAMEGGPPRERARALWAAGYAATLQGDHEAAGRLLDAGQALAEQLGDESLLARIIERQGMVAMYRGQVGRAAELREQGLARFEAAGESQEPNAVLARIGLLANRLVEGDLDKAIRLGLECREICAERGDVTLQAYALSLLAAAERSAGDHAAAAQHLHQALRLRRNPPDPPNVLFGLRVLAWLAADDGHHDRAALLLGAADQVNRTYGLAGIAAAFFPAEHAACEQRVRQALGIPRYDEARRRGADRGVQEAIDLALAPTDQAAPTAPEAGSLRPDNPVATLTDREQRVASLIGQGLTNRQIADALVISPSAANEEVGSIRRKLGLRTRSQIAAWVAGGPSATSGGPGTS